jgi:methyl-accepting chemotaxis protein
MGRTWTFGQRLAAGFGAVVVLTLVMGAVGFYALRSVVEAKDRVIRVAGTNLIDAERMQGASHGAAAAIRGYLLTGEQRFVDEVRVASEELDEALSRIRGRGLPAEAARRADAIEQAWESYEAEVERIIAWRQTDTDVASMAATFEDRLQPRSDAVSGRVAAFVEQSQRDRDAGRAAASETASSAITAIVAVGSGALLLAVIVAFLLTRALTRRVGSSVQHIRSSSAELQAAASQQASGAKEQATAMSEITTTIGELLATSRQIASSGQHVAKMASDSAGSARTGGDAVEKARDAVQGIQRQVDAIVHHMLDLGKKSQHIGGIVEIINELAEQTNILAINATIEAAGAGESGRRFAVVGEEIRKLADRVGSSTKEIRSLIEEVRAAVNATVMATETGSKTVDAGARRFEELEAAFKRIGDIVASTMEAGKEIELSTKQQSTAVEQVNVAISNVAQTTRETEASSEQTLQTASQLTTLSYELSRLVQAEAS